MSYFYPFHEVSSDYSHPERCSPRNAICSLPSLLAVCALYRRQDSNLQKGCLDFGYILHIAVSPRLPCSATPVTWSGPYWQPSSSSFTDFSLLFISHRVSTSLLNIFSLPSVFTLPRIVSVLAILYLPEHIPVLKCQFLIFCLSIVIYTPATLNRNLEYLEVFL